MLLLWRQEASPVKSCVCCCVSFVCLFVCLLLMDGPTYCQCHAVRVVLLCCCVVCRWCWVQCASRPSTRQRSLPDACGRALFIGLSSSPTEAGRRRLNVAYDFFVIQSWGGFSLWPIAHLLQKSMLRSHQRHPPSRRTRHNMQQNTKEFFVLTFSKFSCLWMASSDSIAAWLLPKLFF